MNYCGLALKVQLTGFLCATSVLCPSVVKVSVEKTNHSDAENTEVHREKLSNC